MNKHTLTRSQSRLASAHTIDGSYSQIVQHNKWMRRERKTTELKLVYVYVVLSYISILFVLFRPIYFLSFQKLYVFTFQSSVAVLRRSH